MNKVEGFFYHNYELDRKVGKEEWSPAGIHFSSKKIDSKVWETYNSDYRALYVKIDRDLQAFIDKARPRSQSLSPEDVFDKFQNSESIKTTYRQSAISPEEYQKWEFSLAGKDDRTYHPRLALIRGSKVSHPNPYLIVGFVPVLNDEGIVFTPQLKDSPRIGTFMDDYSRELEESVIKTLNIESLTVKHPIKFSVQKGWQELGNKKTKAISGRTVYQVKIS